MSDTARAASINRRWQELVDEGWEIDVGERQAHLIDPALWQPGTERTVNLLPQGASEPPRYELLWRRVVRTVLTREQAAIGLQGRLVVHRTVTNVYVPTPMLDQVIR
jgi:hypothetical protein